MKRSKKKKKHTQKYWKNQLDPLMSKLIRRRMECAKCGRKGDIQAFDDAHVIGRRNMTLRWDIINHMCLCAPCHQWWWHEEPLESGKWYEEKYPLRYAYLTAVKHVKTHRVEDDYIQLKEWLINGDIDKLHFPLDKVKEIVYNSS